MYMHIYIYICTVRVVVTKYNKLMCTLRIYIYASYVHIICWVYVRALREKFAAKFKVNQSVWCSVSTTQCI